MSKLRAPTFMRFVRLLSRRGVRFENPPIVISISKGVLDLAVQLAQQETADTLAEHAPPPAPGMCWIELPDDPFCRVIGKGTFRAFLVNEERCQLLYSNDIEVLAGAESPETTPCISMSWADYGRSIVGVRPEQLPMTGDEQDFFVAIRAVYVALCAVMAAPGVRVEDNRLREKRLQQGARRAPMVTYRCVDIDLDASAHVPAATVCGFASRGGGVALHWVRGHKRTIQKAGEPVDILVRPHWRGDPRFGIRRRDQNVMRTEEMR